MSKNDLTMRSTERYELGRTFIHGFFFWGGVLGGAITLFSNAGAILELAYWVSWLTDQWIKYSTWLWRYVFSFFNIYVPALAASIMTFIAFMVLGMLSSSFKSNRKPGRETAGSKSYWAFWLLSGSVLVLFLVPHFVGPKASLLNKDLPHGGLIYAALAFNLVLVAFKAGWLSYETASARFQFLNKLVLSIIGMLLIALLNVIVLLVEKWLPN